MDRILLVVVLILVAANCNLGGVSEVFEVRVFTHEISNKTKDAKDATILIKIYGSHGDTVNSDIPSTSSSSDLVSHFGEIGLDVYNVTVTPAIGSPTKILVTQRDSAYREMTWNLNKVLIVDSKAFYYEFLVNKLLNSSSTPSGEVSQEVLLSRTYGGPNSIQSRGCMDNGSRVWYRDQLSNVYKPGIIINLNAINATFTTASGHIVTVPRDQHYDGRSRPLVVNDDWLKLTITLHASNMVIAAINQTGSFYSGGCTSVSSESITSMMGNRKDTWEHFMFYIHYDDSSEIKYVRGGNIRRINKVSTSFCTDVEPEEDPQAFNVLFSCEDSRQRLVDHVIASLNARDVMHCGMFCSRHAHCVSFNFCDSPITSCEKSLQNCELNDSKDGKRDGEGFKLCVLLTRI